MLCEKGILVKYNKALQSYLVYADVINVFKGFIDLNYLYI